MRVVASSTLTLAMLAFVAPASASILTYTYTGVVTFGTDYTGVFGTPGTNLTGQSFVAVERFDTSKSRFVSSDGSTFSSQIGGASYAASAAGAKATLSIGGSTPRSITDDKDSTQNSVQGGTASSTTSIAGLHSFINAQNQVDFYDESLQLAAFSSLITFDYTKPFSLSSTTAAFSGSYALSAYVRDIATGDYIAFSSAFATLRPTSLTLTNMPSTVPLPTSLPLFGAALLSLASVSLVFGRKSAANGTR